jgi:hypothetical protein
MSAVLPVKKPIVILQNVPGGAAPRRADFGHIIVRCLPEIKPFCR